MINGWYNTGDLGFLDRNKNLNITGRNDNTFRVGHEKLCPEEIENVIQKKFNLQEIVITKVKHKILDWVPFGIGVKGKKTKITSDDIINGISEELSNYKVPKEIIFLGLMNTTLLVKVSFIKLNPIVISE